MSDETGQATAFAELVAAMLDARHDYATTAFDEALTRAEADGRLEPAAARLLRWWQRETVRAVVDHAARVLPPAVLALQEAERLAAAEVDNALQTVAVLFPETDAPPAPAPAPGLAAAEEPVLEPALEPAGAPQTVVLPDTDAAGPDATAPIGRVELRPWPGEPAPAQVPAPAQERAAITPPEADDSSARRTLVAGLRVLPDPATPPAPPPDPRSSH